MTWDKNESAFQGMKRTFMHVSGLPPPFFDNKTNYFIKRFIIKIWWGKTWDMHERAFQGLKRTFIHVSGLPPPYFDSKNQILFKLVLISKYGRI